MPVPYIGTAGWTIPRDSAHAFPAEGTHLARYARALNGMEINSSFYRPHMPSTWLKWAASVPDNFRFAVKAPKTITHEARLDCEPELLTGFLAQATLLGEKLGPILFQLPPKLEFDRHIAQAFFERLRDLHAGPVAFEPRNATWFTAPVSRLLARFEIARVAADPARVPEAAIPGGWPGLTYFRLHGSPRTYYSPYSAKYLKALALTVSNCLSLPQSAPHCLWVIFDNTATGAAAQNALTLTEATRAKA